MTQMFKLLADKDIREHGAKFKHFLETTDTGLTQNEIATVSGAFYSKIKILNREIHFYFTFWQMKQIC